MGRPINFDLTPATAVTDGIALSQSLGAAGDFNLNGSLVADDVAVLSTGFLERQIVFTPAADESARTFTVFGKNTSGGDIQEAVTGAAAAFVTARNFAQVTRIASDGATAGALTIGTNLVSSSGWIILDRHRNPFYIGFGVTRGGTIDYSVQHTFDPLISAPPDFVPDVFPHDTLGGNVVTTEDGNYAFPIAAMRIRINTGAGTLSVGIIQAGLRES